MSKYKGYTTKQPKVVLHNDHKKTSRFAYKGQIYEVPFFEYTKKKDEDVKDNVVNSILSGVFL